MSFLMLVSARVDAGLRQQVAEGRRPRPEYLVLEEQHDVRLLDWSQLGKAAARRGARTSVAHARAALSRLGDFEGVLSDGEHVGLPLALGMGVVGRRTPHVVIGHHVTTPAKRLLFRRLGRRFGPQRGISRLVLHSARQLTLAESELQLEGSCLSLLPYGVDSGFWAPRDVPERGLVVSAGREHRDFLTLAAACRPLETAVLVAHGSSHSPAARRAEPEHWPRNFVVRALDHLALREAYAEAAVVVVPLVPSDFQAGVTTLLEAMAMGKAVVVTATAGLRDLFDDGLSALAVPPGDADAMREAVASLLASPRERARLGANARAAAEARFGLERYAAGLAAELQAVTRGGRHRLALTGKAGDAMRPSPLP